MSASKYHVVRMPIFRVKLFKLENDVETEILLADSLKLKRFSPSGFEYGYGGHGPSQLALAILLDAVGKDLALRFYTGFKFEFISVQPQKSPDFWLDESVVLEWVSRMAEPEETESEEESPQKVAGSPTTSPEPAPPKKPFKAKFYVGQKVIVKNCAQDWLNGEWGMVAEVNGSSYQVKPYGREFDESELETYEEEFYIDEDELKKEVL